MPVGKILCAPSLSSETRKIISKWRWGKGGGRGRDSDNSSRVVILSASITLRISHFFNHTIYFRRKRQILKHFCLWSNKSCMGTVLYDINNIWCLHNRWSQQNRCCCYPHLTKNGMGWHTTILKSYNCHSLDSNIFHSCYCLGKSA